MNWSEKMTLSEVIKLMGRELRVKAYIKKNAFLVTTQITDVREAWGRVDVKISSAFAGDWVAFSSLEIVDVP